MEIIRTKKEIELKIKELIEDEDNFITDNYGSEAVDNGEFETYYSKYNTKETLEKFVKWLTIKNENKKGMD